MRRIIIYTHYSRTDRVSRINEQPQRVQMSRQYFFIFTTVYVKSGQWKWTKGDGGPVL